MSKYLQNISDDAPKEIQIFETKKTIKNKAIGENGILDLELEANSDGKTIITKQYSQDPLLLQRALYPENSMPNMAYLYVMSSSGGILQGDRHKIDILLKKNALAHLTTQGATRIYGMNSNYASQIVNITVDENCYLEYIPDQIIPYKNSRYYQRVNLKVDENSDLIYSEILTPGRVAMGESFDYDICYMRTSCKNLGNKIRFLENLKIEPKKQQPQNFGLLGEYQTVGTVFILTRKKNVKELELTINEEIVKKDAISGGTSILPDDSGIIIRILGNKTDDVFNMVYNTLEICRKKILGTTFSRTRKN
ncbi:MAG: urease accessory protein UreD [Nitrosopumilus sp.]|nr:urease accessory protein UreD [Nitrosopumilus sp.]